jgi:membrane protein
LSGRKKGRVKRLLFFWEVLKKFDGDHGFFLSAGITFNLLICLIPFTLLLLGLLGTYLYSDREVLTHIRRYFENAVPSLDPKIMNNILKIIRHRRIVGILGIGGLVWTSTWVFSSLRTAFNLIFQVKKDRGILEGKAIDLLMIVLAGVFLLLSMMLTSGITVLQSQHLHSFGPIGPVLRWTLKYVIPFFFTFSICVLTFKIIPNMKIGLRTAFKAALFTSLFWELAKQLFGWYVLHLGRFSVIYGSLSALAVFFLWIYYSSAILLLGGEIAFLLEKKKGR